MASLRASSLTWPAETVAVGVLTAAAVTAPPRDCSVGGEAERMRVAICGGSAEAAVAAKGDPEGLVANAAAETAGEVVGRTRQAEEG